jgi:hypothetical protein
VSHGYHRRVDFEDRVPRALIQEPFWPGLAADHRIAMEAAWRRFAAGDYRAAAQGFEAAYRLLLDNQPEGRRFHKGESLHNRGLALMWAGSTQDALSETLAAFVEDALSLGEEDQRLAELDRPAAHNLVYVFGLAGPFLARLAASVRGLVARGVVLPDPHLFLVAPVAPAPSASRLRIPGEFHAPPERRVFIGGWYGGGRLTSVLEPLRDHLDSIGFDGVLASDFATPDGWGQDEVAKGLLGLCHYGVFEVSESAGQVEEIASSPDTMRRPDRMLAVFDKKLGPRPRISGGMTIEKLDRWQVPRIPYGDIVELKGIVEAWLKA